MHVRRMSHREAQTAPGSEGGRHPPGTAPGKGAAALSPQTTQLGRALRRVDRDAGFIQTLHSPLLEGGDRGQVVETLTEIICIINEFYYKKSKKSRGIHFTVP